MWDLRGPGLEPMSPALAAGFLTTVPPGKYKTDQLLTRSTKNEREKTQITKIRNESENITTDSTKIKKRL